MNYSKRTEARATRTAVIGGAIAVTTALILVLPTIALADKPANPECWGTVSSQAATTQGRDFGEHAADPLPDVEGNETPRVGIANVLDPESPSHPSELGAALGEC